MSVPGILVTPEWLAAHRGEVKLVDARWYTAKYERDGRAEWQAERIPGAVHLDLSTELADASTGLRNSLAPPEKAAAVLGAKGLKVEDAVVVYDDIGFSACRVAWVLEYYGQESVAVLDGGLGAWKAAGYALEAGPPSPPAAAVYTPRVLDSRKLIDVDELRAALGAPGLGIVDARSPTRFDKEGRIAGASSLHFRRCLREDTAWFRSRDELRAMFEEAGLLRASTLVASCGSGVTACIVLWALRLSGRDDVRLYDGSWDEWSRAPSLPTDGGPGG